MNPGEWITERYIIEARAGAGGMGTVYKAHDRDGRPVAVKVMLHGSAELGERFTREAQLLMALDHPAIVQCLDTGITADRRRFLVMEWLDGIELGEYVATHRLSVIDSLALVGRIAEALGAVHEHDVIHRDVKPANIFLPNSDINNAKLLDFGIAHWSSASRLTASGTQMGTPAYMAPEQILGDDVDRSADIFSLGCVLYLCLSGKPAYSGRHLQEVFYKILTAETPQISHLVRDVPQPVIALLTAMMAKDRSMRPKHAADAAQRIAWIRANVALSHAPPEILRGAVPPGAITEHEQRLVSVVASAARPSGRSEVPGVRHEEEPFLDPQTPARPVPTLDTLLRRYESLGARFEHRAEGVLLAVFDTRTAATDQADDAARYALDMHSLNPATDIVVATGRAEVRRQGVSGEVIDRVRALLDVARTAASGGVRMCRVTAKLIEQRFETDSDQREYILIRKRHLPGRTQLLGHYMPFIGRAREIASLHATLSECVEESMARAVLITGPMGIGKSRLAQHFSESVAGHEVHVEVLQASGDPMRTGSPLELLAQVIRGFAGIQEGEPEAVRRDKLATRVRATVPSESADRVAMFLGELIRTPWPEDDVQLRAARRDPQLMGAQIRRASQELLSAQTDRHPVLLLLENLHWSDRATVAWVESVLRGLRQRPLLVVAIGRYQLHEQFPGIWSKHNLLELRLRGLSPRSAEKLVRSVLGASIIEPWVDKLVQRADGNPLYLEELIRSMAAERPQLPGTVLAMMHVRLQDIPDMPRRALRAASIVGDQFWHGCITALCGREVTVERALRWLIHEEFLVESRSSKFVGEAEYRFRHDLIREAAYGMLTVEDRRRAHRLTGQWLQQAGETDALIIAQHFERGSEPEEARPLLLQAAVSACRTGDLEAAEAIAARGLPLGANDETHGALRAIQVKAYQWRGQLERCLEAGEEALALVHDGSRTWYEVAEDVVAAQGGLDRFAELKQRAESMTRGCPPGHDPSGWLIVAARLAWMLFVHGETRTAQSLLAQVDLESGRLADIESTVAAHVHATRACGAWFVASNPAGLLRELRRAVARYDEAGDVYNACDQRANVGYAEMTLGLYKDAEVTLRTALSDARDMKVDRSIDICKQNLSLTLCYLGKLDEAYTLASQSASGYEARGDQRLAAGSRIYLSTISLLAGEPVTAEEHARKAVSLCTEHSPLQLLAQATRARALVASARPSEALDIMRAVMRRASESGAFGDSEITIRLIWAEALYENGEPKRAREAIIAARDRLLEQSDKIDDATWQQSFLYQVADHARILELFQTWS